jgi:pyruvate kinase
MRTKIVCTLGPATDTEPVIREVIRAGMDIARINFSHGTHEEHARRIALVRRIAEEENKLVSIMGDLQGPKYRVGVLPEAGTLLTVGQEVTFSAQQPFSAAADKTIIPLPHPDLILVMRPEQRVLIDDGALELRVLDMPANDEVRCQVVTGGMLTSHKGVAVPGARLAIIPITEKDRTDITFALEQQVDALAQSFVRSAADVRALREIVTSRGGRQYIVAKIEKPEAINDLANILREVDGVMVARGDLGVEAPAEEVPFYQKKIIQSCLHAGIPVITATQMLQSMIHAPRPTRAEASDVANAVLDGTDAVMLSAETATGEYPVEAVRALERISSRAETECCGSALLSAGGVDEHGNIPSPDAATQAITSAAVQVAQEVGAKVIVCTTTSGYTARMVARHRPSTPIIALTPEKRTYQYTAFMWDVRAVLVPGFDRTNDMFEAARQQALQQGYAVPGDCIVITAGMPLGSGAGTTNLIKVHKV